MRSAPVPPRVSSGREAAYRGKLAEMQWKPWYTAVLFRNTDLMRNLQNLLEVLKAFLSRLSPAKELAREAGYRAYTKRFDQIVSAESLIEEYRPAVINGKTIQDIYKDFQELTYSWRMQADIAALEASARVRAQVGENRLRETVVTLLIDHSGSMRDQKILLAVAAVSVATNFLVNLGVKVEILGFTTSSWQGGTSRWIWQARGRPQNPGRLCDLLHIIYREADATIPGAPQNLCAMLLPNLLKENVDGEAIQWAVKRLHSRPEANKNIVVLSDGAPVDDSTLLENGEDYLWEHLASVLDEENSAGDVLIAGLGICYASKAPYKLSAEINTPEDLRSTLINLLEQMLGGTNPSTGRPTGLYH